MPDAKQHTEFLTAHHLGQTESSAESVAEERSCSKDQVNLARPFEGKDHFEGWAKSF